MPDRSSAFASRPAWITTERRSRLGLIRGLAAADELTLPLQLQLQSDLLQLPLEIFVFRHQLGNLLAFEMQLAMQHVQILPLIASRIDQRPQRGTSQMWAMAHARAGVFVAGIKAEFHRHPSLDTINLACFSRFPQDRFPIPQQRHAPQYPSAD
jgi:hypothetical protein